MPRLTWSDLLIEDISPDQFRDWIAPWSGVVAGRVAPAFLSKFGFWFLRRPEGHVEMLDVFTGELHRAADTYETSVAEVNEQWWQEVLHETGKVPGPGQCNALCPHPALGGRNLANGEAVDPTFLTVMDVVVWQSLYAQALGVGH